MPVVRLHPTRQLQLIALAVFAVPMASVSSAAADKALTPQQVEFFEKRVRPLLISRCFQCHSGKSKGLKGGLRLDSHRAVLKGGDTGTAVVPGEPDKSLLVRSIRYQAYEMPPTGKLKPAEIAVLVEWVRRGAFWPAGKSAAIARTAEGIYDYKKIKATHWAYRPLGKPKQPAVKGANWIRQDIDRFVLARLEAAGLGGGPAAGGGRGRPGRRRGRAAAAAGRVAAQAEQRAPGRGRRPGVLGTCGATGQQQV